MRNCFVYGLALLGLLPAAAATADTVELSGGTRIQGVVLSETGDEPTAVRLLLPQGDEVVFASPDVKGVTKDPSGPQPGQYMRFVEPGSEAGGLDAAVVSFVPTAGGPRVDLVAAVHIADRAFFRAVQRVLEDADVVLYEGVMPEGASPDEFLRPPAGADNPIRSMQQKLAKWFDLSFQLEEVAYGRPHFVHADVTTEQMEAAGLALAPAPGTTPGAGAPGTPGAPEGGQTDLLGMVEKLGPMLDMLLSNPSSRATFKAVFGRVLGQADVGAMLGTMMPDLADALLHKRNAVVIERLKAWAPKAKTSIAVFYGAGHMPDVERILVEELGYRRAGGRWLRAWSLDPVGK